MKLMYLALALLLVACARPVQVRQPRLTGTCEGACEHYLGCRGGYDDESLAVCVEECGGVFSDSESLRAYESLECEAAVSFVEGSSGRGPGGSPPDQSSRASN